MRARPTRRAPNAIGGAPHPSWGRGVWGWGWGGGGVWQDTQQYQVPTWWQACVNNQRKGGWGGLCSRDDGKEVASWLPTQEQPAGAAAQESPAGWLQHRSSEASYIHRCKASQPPAGAESKWRSRPLQAGGARGPALGAQCPCQLHPLASAGGTRTLLATHRKEVLCACMSVIADQPLLVHAQESDSLHAGPPPIKGPNKEVP